MYRLVYFIFHFQYPSSVNHDPAVVRHTSYENTCIGNLTQTTHRYMRITGATIVTMLLDNSCSGYKYVKSMECVYHHVSSLSCSFLILFFTEHAHSFIPNYAVYSSRWYSQIPDIWCVFCLVTIISHPRPRSCIMCFEFRARPHFPSAKNELAHGHGAFTRPEE